jgi:hypothetical protein
MCVMRCKAHVLGTACGRLETVLRQRCQALCDTYQCLFTAVM